MMGERTVSRSTFTAGGSAFPVMGEREVSRAALEAGGSGFPARGRCAWSRWLAAASFLRRGDVLPSRLAAVPFSRAGGMIGADWLSCRQQCLPCDKGTDDRTPLGESPWRGKLYKNGVECPARHLQDSQGQERAFLALRARAVSRPAITAGGDGFGRHRLPHGGSAQ
jgi:hypothetical protein